MSDLLAEMVNDMIAAGASGEVIGIAVRALRTSERQEAERKAKRAEQKRNERRARLSRDMSQLVAELSRDIPAEANKSAEKPNQAQPPQPMAQELLARVEDSSIPLESTGKKITKIEAVNTIKKGVETKKTPKQILTTVLRLEIAEAVIEHRAKAVKVALTSRAAELLAKEFSKTTDPNAAADVMIARGWQGFKAEWMENDTKGNGNGRGREQPSRKGSLVDAGRELLRRLDEQDAKLRDPTSDSFGDPVVRLLPGVRRQ